MNGKIAIVGLLLGAVTVGGITVYVTYLGPATATCGQNMTLASYSFTSDTSLSARLCKIGPPETIASFQVTTVSGSILPSNGSQFQPTPVTSTPTTIQVQLANGYTFQIGHSYFLYINTNVGTHKFTVTR